MGVREAQAAHGSRVLRPLLRRAHRGDRQLRSARRATSAATGREQLEALRGRPDGESTRGRRRDARLRELDVPRRRYAPAGQGPPEPPLPSSWVVHRDVDVACATLSAAWPNPHLSVPDVLAPGLALRLLRHQPGPRLGGRARALREPAQRLLAAAPRRGLHAAALRARPSSSSCSTLGYGVTNAAYRTTPGSGDLRRGDFDAGAARAASRGSCGRARSPSSARRPTAAPSASAPSSGRRLRTLGSTALYVLPSTSPANAAVPYAERLRWFRALRDVARAGAARRRCARSSSTPTSACSCSGSRTRSPTTSGGRRPGGGIEPGESDEAGAPARAARGDRPRGSRARPGRLGARRTCFPWDRRLCTASASASTSSASSGHEVDADDRPRPRGRLRPPLVDARRARGDRRAARAARARDRAARRCSATARRPSRST